VPVCRIFNLRMWRLSMFAKAEALRGGGVGLIGYLWIFTSE